MPHLGYTVCMDLALDIRKTMKQNGKSIYAIAKAAGVSVSMVQRFEAGLDIRLATASKLCKALGLRLTKGN